jgi:hypothetical protein
VLAVPRSMARSLENNDSIERRLNEKLLEKSSGPSRADCRPWRPRESGARGEEL